MKIHTIGIDLGKTSFHLVGLSERGEVVVRKRFTRLQLLRFTANRRVVSRGRCSTSLRKEKWMQKEELGKSGFLEATPRPIDTTILAAFNLSVEPAGLIRSYCEL